MVDQAAPGASSIMHGDAWVTLHKSPLFKIWLEQQLFWVQKRGRGQRTPWVRPVYGEGLRTTCLSNIRCSVYRCIRPLPVIVAADSILLLYATIFVVRYLSHKATERVHPTYVSDAPSLGT